MKKVEPFKNDFHQSIYDALKKGDLDALCKLDQQEALDGRILPFIPIDILKFYQPFSIVEKFKDFLESHHMNSNHEQSYTERVVAYDNGYQRIRDFKHPFSQMLMEGWHVLTAACDETGNIEAVRDYLNAGHDFHRYIEEFVRGAIEEEFYAIAELLIQDGAHLSKFPTILHGILSLEFDRMVYERCDCENLDYHYTDTRAKFAIEHGALINSYDISGYTPLDKARKSFHEPAFELIRKHGGRYGFSAQEKEFDDWNDLTQKDGTFRLKDGTAYFGRKDKTGEEA